MRIVRTAIDAVRQHGGTVAIWPGGPGWLRKRMGGRTLPLFDEVRSAGFAQHPGLITDAAISPIRWLPNLEYLDLGSTGIGDAGLIHIDNMTRLEELNLQETPITDAGLMHLGRMRRLHTLRLDGTSIGGAGSAKKRNAPDFLQGVSRQLPFQATISRPRLSFTP